MHIRRAKRIQSEQLSTSKAVNPSSPQILHHYSAEFDKNVAFAVNPGRTSKRHTYLRTVETMFAIKCSRVANLETHNLHRTLST